MKPRMQKRMEKVKETITSLPIRKKVLDGLFELFVEFGELPEEQHLADAVVRRALGKEEDHSLLRVISSMPKEALPEVREMLFDEAVFDTGLGRDMARLAIAKEVALGGDVRDPRFASYHGIPEHGSMGMHVIGHPQWLAIPPYVDQANRLFARHRVIRARIDYSDPNWFDPFEDALLAFKKNGKMPEEGIERDWVLSEAELQALMRHKDGEDVSELMAALNAAAKAKTEDREAAVQKVVDLLARRKAARRGEAT